MLTSQQLHVYSCHMTFVNLAAMHMQLCIIGRLSSTADSFRPKKVHQAQKHKANHQQVMMGSDLSKRSEGEKACLICYDEFSGCYQAFSQTARSIENNVNCLRKFGGTKGDGKALCSVKSDSAQELTEAAKQLGWLPEPGLPNDPYTIPS